MTYKNIQAEYKRLYGRSIKSCWIADVKRDLQLTKRISYNRIDIDSVKFPCINLEIKERIKKLILRALGKSEL